jgi:hypothetical protein
MKKIWMMVALSLTIMACGSSEKSSVDLSITDRYLAVKDALVKTDALKTQQAAKAFMEVNSNKALRPALEAIAATDDVAVQRQAFEDLSMQMYSLVKSEGAEITLYKQYCPMAFNNKGAYWLAAEKEVNNPYFGDRMLHCGSVQEELKQ